ncbi:UNVERIFIED_CONTAM: copper resistance protein CopC, partial [Bacteroidetes bacterium 56_B9]
NAWVTVDGAISEGLFDVDHMPLRMNGLSVTAPDGTTSPAPEAVMGKMRTSVDIPLPQDGTYRIALVSTNVFGSYKDGNEVKRFRG